MGGEAAPADLDEYRRNKRGGKKRRKSDDGGQGGGSAPPPTGPGGEDGRPVIKTYGGGLGLHMRDAEQALGVWSRASPFNGIYVQDGTPRLVQPIRLAAAGQSGGVARPAGAMVMHEPGSDYLAALLGSAARFERYDQRREDWVTIDPPVRLVRAMMGAAPWQALPVLAGVTAAPTLRPDGSLVDQPGYDERTGLLFAAGEAVFEQVPASPTREQAMTALELLKDLLEGFPFVSAAARSVALAAIITAVVRPAMRAAPIFIFSAPRSGTGKTLLATVVGMIATGVAPVLISQAEKPEEERKRLLSVLMDAPRVVCFDNVERPMSGDSLCTILTESRWSDRVLGETKTVNVSTNVTWLATGNNLVVNGDLAQRAVECRLDANEASPEERQFEVNLHQAVPERRGGLVVAALTIVRHWIAAGRPDVPIPQMGRFEAWTELVRKPLVHLGEADPIETRKAVGQSDPVRDRLIGLLLAWRELYEDRSQTVREATRTTHEELRNALLAVAEKAGEPDAQRIGSFIKKYRDRWERMPSRDGSPLESLRFIEGERDRGNVARWCVEVRDDG